MEEKKSVEKVNKPELTSETLKNNIIERIRVLYETEKGKKYIAHLSVAFIRDSFSIVENPIEGGMKCAITSTKLLSLKEANGNKKSWKLAYESKNSNMKMSIITIYALKSFIDSKVAEGDKYLALTLKERKEDEIDNKEGVKIVTIAERLFEDAITNTKKHKESKKSYDSQASNRYSESKNEDYQEEVFKPATFSWK